MFNGRINIDGEELADYLTITPGTTLKMREKVYKGFCEHIVKMKPAYWVTSTFYSLTGRTTNQWVYPKGKTLKQIEKLERRAVKSQPRDGVALPLNVHTPTGKAIRFHKAFWTSRAWSNKQDVEILSFFDYQMVRRDEVIHFHTYVKPDRADFDIYGAADEWYRRFGQPIDLYMSKEKDSEEVLDIKLSTEEVRNKWKLEKTEKLKKQSFTIENFENPATKREIYNVARHKYWLYDRFRK